LGDGSGFDGGPELRRLSFERARSTSIMLGAAWAMRGRKNVSSQATTRQSLDRNLG
jgi:hypothetical protein